MGRNQGRYTREFQTAVGKLLLDGRGVNQRILAEQLQVSERTLRNWKRHAKSGKFPELGRPKTSHLLKLNAENLVREEFRIQGVTGWRPVDSVLKGLVSTRLIQECVREIKAEIQLVLKNRIQQNQLRTKVLVKNGIWTQDATHLGRENGKKLEAQVIKDRGTLKLLETKTGEPADGGKIIKIFEDLKTSGRELPLVLMTDNGSNYCSQEVEEYLQKEKIIHLKSEPRTPEQNGAAEIGIRELKSCAGIKRDSEGTKMGSMEKLLKKTAKLLNNGRKRMSLGYMTSEEAERKLPSGTELVGRDKFYTECKKLFQRVLNRTTGARKIWRAMRAACFYTLRKYGLIEQTRGGRLIGMEKAEVFL